MIEVAVYLRIFPLPAKRLMVFPMLEGSGWGAFPFFLEAVRINHF
jgi:hypothetical protein